jgi:hypothetical protein
MRITLLAGAAFILASSGTYRIASAESLPRVNAPFSAEITLNLSEAQNDLRNMLNGIRHVSRCDANWNVWNANVIPNGGGIKLDFDARYFLNKCAIVTLPEWHGLFHVEWHDQVVGETTVVSQAGHIAVDVWPVIQNGAITVDANVVTADMNGLLGALKLNGQVKDFLNGKIRDALKAQLSASLPPAMLEAGVQFSDITFFDLGAGKLGLKLKATGTIHTNS